MFKLIGLAGKAGSGKSLLGDYIESIDPENIRQDSFAYPMKKALAVMLDISVEKLELLKNSGKHHQLLNKTYREMLQTIGTEWGRNIIHENMWTLLAKERILNHPDYITIMTDVRFNNEAEMIKSMGGIIVGISRHTDKCRDAGTHVSENSLDQDWIDYLIPNNSDNPNDLYKSWNDLAFLMS